MAANRVAAQSDPTGRSRRALPACLVISDQRVWLAGGFSCLRAGISAGGRQAVGRARRTLRRIADGGWDRWVAGQIRRLGPLTAQPRGGRGRRGIVASCVLEAPGEPA